MKRIEIERKVGCHTGAVERGLDRPVKLRVRRAASVAADTSSLCQGQKQNLVVSAFGYPTLAQNAASVPRLSLIGCIRFTLGKAWRRQQPVGR